MAYPGNSELTIEAQERVMTAFRQVVTKLQDGQRDEALIGLEFVLRLDPAFAPAVNLQHQLKSGGDVDLAQVIAHLQAPSTEEINLLLVDAVEAFNQRNFVQAKELVEKVLLELPGHQEARQFQAQVEEALKVEGQVARYLTQAQEAVERGEPQEAANFVMMAQSLDPHHPGITAKLQEIDQAGGGSAAPTPPAAVPPETQPIQVPATETVPPPAPPEPDLGVPDDGDWTPPGAADDLGAPPVEGWEAPAMAEDLSAPAPTQEPPVPEEPEEFTFSAEAAIGPAGEDASPDDFTFAADTGDPDDEFVFDQDAPPEDFSTPRPAPAADDFSLEANQDLFSADDEFSTDDGDLADLFEADGPGAAAQAEGAVAPEDAERIELLLNQGSEAFDRGDFQEAIDVWSRVYLLDPSHTEAARRIDEARQRKDESDRQVEQFLYEANDAVEAGDLGRAQDLLAEILAIHPNHPEAVELRERLGAGSAGDGPAVGDLGAIPPPPAPPEPADLDDDLFSHQPGEPAAASLGAGRAVEAAPAPRARRRLPSLPWPILLAAVAALLVVFLGVWFGNKLLSSGGQSEETAALNRVLNQAEELHQQGRTEEAIHLLQEFPASGLDQSRVARRLAKYQEALAPPTPTPIPHSLTRAEELIEEGQWMAAYAAVRKGLEGQPQNQQMLQVKDRILRHEPLIASLATAIDNGDWGTAVSISQDLVARHPGDAEFEHELGRALFNAGVVALREHNMTAAEAHMRRLDRIAPGDSDVERILRFIAMYKTRPADMQLRIFIGSLDLR